MTAERLARLLGRVGLLVVLVIVVDWAGDLPVASAGWWACTWTAGIAGFLLLDSFVMWLDDRRGPE